MMQLGNIHITPINDVMTHVDGGGAFGLVPRKLWSRYFTPDDDNLVPMSQLCLYVEADSKRLVIDTGLGTKLEDKHRRFWQVQNEGGLVRGLASIGVSPEQIDIVVNTHLHSDHCGGNTRWQSESDHTLVPTFPNATYIVQKQEYEDATHPNERTAATYLAQNFEPIASNEQLKLVEGDCEIVAGIRGIVTRGHTPGHMSIAFESEGQSALFVCDLASYAVHFEKLAWMTAYDVEPLHTLESKRRMQAWALERDATLFFVHDPFRPVGKLHPQGSGYVVEKVDVEVIGLEEQ
jgi:glyoxylase-like metal-dependent hydrolase (beta-lactamase superfamily II)